VGHFHFQEHNMIKVGDTLPAATLMEYSEVEGNGCSIGPNPVDVAKASAGKTIALFALPGAFTPTCSAKHVPGYMDKHAELTAAGVDEIWCVSVNDAFVMGAWGRDLHTNGKVRMLGDGFDLGPDRQRFGSAFQPLFHAGQKRQGVEPECRRSWQV
jgi:peroxiredoxin